MNDWLLLLLGGSISGAAVAGIARAIMPGKQRLTGIEMLIIGTAAGFVGGLISGLFGLDDETGWMRVIPLAISVGLAAITIAVWINFRTKAVTNAVVPGPAGAGKAAMEKSSDAAKGAVKQSSGAMNTMVDGKAKDVGGAPNKAAGAGPARKATDISKKS